METPPQALNKCFDLICILKSVVLTRVKVIILIKIPLPLETEVIVSNRASTMVFHSSYWEKLVLVLSVVSLLSWRVGPKRIKTLVLIIWVKVSKHVFSAELSSFPCLTLKMSVAGNLYLSEKIRAATTAFCWVESKGFIPCLRNCRASSLYYSWNIQVWVTWHPLCINCFRVMWILEME